jgi:hypothetical protein
LGAKCTYAVGFAPSAASKRRLRDLAPFVDTEQGSVSGAALGAPRNPGPLERRPQQARDDVRRRALGAGAKLVPVADRRAVVKRRVHPVSLRDVDVGLLRGHLTDARAHQPERHAGDSREIGRSDARGENRDDDARRRSLCCGREHAGQRAGKH